MIARAWANYLTFQDYHDRELTSDFYDISTHENEVEEFEVKYHEYDNFWTVRDEYYDAFMVNLSWEPIFKRVISN